MLLKIKIFLIKVLNFFSPPTQACSSVFSVCAFLPVNTQNARHPNTGSHPHHQQISGVYCWLAGETSFTSSLCPDVFFWELLWIFLWCSSWPPAPSCGSLLLVDWWVTELYYKAAVVMTDDGMFDCVLVQLLKRNSSWFLPDLTQ